MDDESTTAPDQDTPLIDSAPDEGHAQEPQVDYAKRYNDLRPEFDRTKQQLSQYETQLEAARNGDVDAIRALGFDVDTPDPTPEYENDPYAAKLAALEQKNAEFDQWKQQQEAERVAHSIRSHVDQLAQANEVALTDADKEYIFGRAVAGEKIDQTTTEAAFKAHTEYLASLRNRFEEEYVPTKRASRPGSGQAASKQPDLDNPQERVAYMQSLLHGGEAA